MYIADGHHRTAAACRYLLLYAYLCCSRHYSNEYWIFLYILLILSLFCRERTKASQGRNIPRSARYLTALLFPASQLNVLSYNRCVRSLPIGTTTTTLLEQISTVFDIQTLTCSLSGVEATATETQCGIPTFPRTESPTSISVASPISSPFNTHSGSRSCIPQNMSYPTAPPAEQGVIYMYIEHIWYSLRVRPDHCIENNSSDPLSGIGCQVRQKSIFLLPICCFLNRILYLCVCMCRFYWRGCSSQCSASALKTMRTVWSTVRTIATTTAAVAIVIYCSVVNYSVVL